MKFIVFFSNFYFLFLIVASQRPKPPPGNNGGRPPPPRPPPRPGPNANIRSSVNSSILNDLFYTGLEITEKRMKLPENSGKTLLEVAQTVKLPQNLCSCFAKPKCDFNSKFHQIDGSCNNMLKPWLGKSETPYKRLLPPEYQDLISAPRSISVTNKQLPNPRLISRTIMNDNAQFENFWTHLGTLFGQFIAHDVTSLSASSDKFGNPLDCPCNSNHRACLSVSMPVNENIMKQSCMQFTRSSAVVPSYDCNMGHREQLNLLSSYLDATQIYGDNYNTSLSLRLFSDGLLKSSNGVTARPYLPKSNKPCSNSDESMLCFKAGESRTTENLGLTGIQLLFMREHNRIATELQAINKNWNDNLVFYETRRIITAIYQNIIFNEWLPSVLGKKFHSDKQLTPLENGFFTGYDPNINPSLFNEFAAAGLRFGHSLIRNQLNRFDSKNQLISASLNISKLIFQSDEAYNSRDGGLESIFLGLINQQSSKFDLSLVDTLQNHLFETIDDDGTIIAIDLASANIQRGRDHGIAPYVKYRSLCGLKLAKTFQDLSDSISTDKIAKLQSVYEDVADIDLWVGGLSETPNQPDALIGPTFSCILAKQFRDLKRGDRFYYENAPNKDVGTSLTAFTLDQLNEIRKVTIASLICKDFDIDSIQPNAFLKASSMISNEKVMCSMLSKIDLTKWGK